jgi:serine/threonine protein kinase
LSWQQLVAKIDEMLGSPFIFRVTLQLSKRSHWFQVNLGDEFDILQIVGEGWFGKILLVEHKATDTEMVLKALPKPYTSIKDFYREFHYGLHLGAHKNIITTYDVAFETAGFYVFSQEYAPLGKESVFRELLDYSFCSAAKKG